MQAYGSMLMDALGAASAVFIIVLMIVTMGG